MKEEVAEYLRQGKAHGWSEGTINVYRKNLNSLLKFLRRQRKSRLADIQPKDLDDYMLEMRSRGNRKNTMLRASSTARQFFRWLAERGKILSNPARDIALPDDENLELPVAPLEEDEIEALFNSLPKRDVIDLRNRLHLELLYGCALRIAESVALNLNDVDMRNRTVRVIDGKGGKDRLIPMMSGVLGALRDYLALRRSLLHGPDNGALLLSRNGKRLNVASFRQYLRELNKSRGLKSRRIHPHLLRHSIAVHLLRNGADIRHVQAFLGHARLDTTKIYLRLVPGRLKEDYDKAMPEIAVME